MCTKPNHDTEVFSQIKRIVSNHNATILALYESQTLDGSSEGFDTLYHTIQATDALIEKTILDAVAAKYGLYQ